MIDFHSHILPYVDDGSRDVAMTLSMCRILFAQGIHRMAATPHFYASRDSIEHFLSRRRESLERVHRAMQKTGTGDFPHLFPGAEVYYFPGIGRAAMLPKLCMAGSSVLLLEMPFCQWTDGMYQDILAMHQRQGLTVILAHIERYVKYQRDTGIWDKVMDLAHVYPQINAGAFLDRKKRRFCLSFLEQSDVLLGTDCHNLTDRKPNMEAGQDRIRKKLGGQRLDALDEFGERMFDKWVDGRYSCG